MTNFLKPQGKLFYGWVIIAVTIVIVAAGTIIRPSFALFYVAILEEFGWSRASTAMITSIAGLSFGLSAPVSGFLIDRFGPRKLFPIAAIFIAVGTLGASQANEIWQFSLFYGVIATLGLALIGFAPIVTLASNWFVKWRALAIGLCTIGIQGAMLMSPLVQYLITNLGWRNTYLAIGIGVPIIILPLSLLLRTRPRDIGLTPDGLPHDPEDNRIDATQEDNYTGDREWISTDWTIGRALRTYRFWSLFGIMLCLSFSFTILFTHQVAHMVDIGFTPSFGANMLVIFAISSVLGRFGGVISDKLGREITYTIGTTGVAFGILMLILAKDPSDAWMLYVYVVFYGFFAGSNAPTYAASVADLFHGRHFGTILGSADLGFGIGAAVGPWLGGYIFDTTGSYTLAFITAIVAIAVACIFLWIAAPRQIRPLRGNVSFAT